MTWPLARALAQDALAESPPEARRAVVGGAYAYRSLPRLERSTIDAQDFASLLRNRLRFPAGNVVEMTDIAPAEYLEAIERRKRDEETAELQREALVREGHSADEVQRAMEPLRAFHARFSEEIESYENARRGRGQSSAEGPHPAFDVGRAARAGRA